MIYDNGGIIEKKCSYLVVCAFEHAFPLLLFYLGKSKSVRGVVVLLLICRYANVGLHVHINNNANTREAVLR